MAGTFILDRVTLEPIAVIEDYHQIEFEREFFTFGKFSMTMNFQQFNARTIEKGQIIGIALDETKSFDRVFMVEQIELTQGANPVDELITVSGRDIGGMSQERLIVPDFLAAYDSFNGASESLMKYFVTRHMVAAINPNRNIPNLFVKTDQGRGVVIDFQARYQVLSEALEEIGRNAEMGWDFFFEENTGTFQFDILLGNDLTDSVFFDLDFESIITQKLLRTDWGTKNVAFIGGGGEGAARPVATTFLGANAPTGFARREAWVDAQDTDDTAIPTILTTKGKSFLEETDIDEAVEVDINPFGPYSYRTDFDLGDAITVRNKRWSFLKEMQIVGVKVTITTEFPRPLVSVVLDKPLPRLERQIKQNFKQYKPGTRR